MLNQLKIYLNNKNHHYFIILMAIFIFGAVSCSAILVSETQIGRKIGQILGLNSSITVSLTTPTQAVLSYETDDLTACTLEVSESSSYTPVVNDVNGSLFSNSNIDILRDTSLATSTSRMIVIGKRKAEAGVDGNYYSRALQNNTLHYFRINCDGDISTGTFTTDTLQPSDFGEPQIYDSNAPDNYAFPTIDFSSSSFSFYDPHTGVKLVPFTRPQTYGVSTTTATSSLVAYAPNGGWSSDSNGNLIDGSYATVTSTTSPLFVRFDTICPNSNCQNDSKWTTIGKSLDDIEVQIKAYNPDDQNAQICISVNGISCSTAWKSITVGSSASTTTFPSNFATPMLNGWKGVGFPNPPGRPDLATKTGTVNTSGTSVTWISGNTFPPVWTAGTKITIGGVEYTISSYNHNKSLTLSSSAGTQTGASYLANNTGLLIRKSSAASDTLSVDGVKMRYAASDQFQTPANGSYFPCNTNSFTDPNLGVTAYMCKKNSQVFEWIPSLERSVYLGFIQVPFNYFSPTTTIDQTAVGDCGANLMFHPTNPNKFLCYVGEASENGYGPSLTEITYTGNYQTSTTSDGSMLYKTIVRLTKPSSGTGLWQQAEANDPNGYDTARYPYCSYSQQGTYIYVGCWAGQDYPSYLIAVNAATGLLTSGSDSFSKAPHRWSGAHTFQNAGNDQYNFWVSKDLQGDTYKVGVTQVGSTGTSTMSNTYTETCPSDIDQVYKDDGATGSNCATITVQGEPCKANPNSWESSNLLDCTWDASKVQLNSAATTPTMDIQVGDQAQAADSGGTKEGILFVKSLGGNQWVILRDYKKYHSATLDYPWHPFGKRSFSGTWQIEMACQSCTGAGYVAWKGDDLHGDNMLPFRTLQSAQHGDISLGVIMSSYDGVYNTFRNDIWPNWSTTTLAAVSSTLQRGVYGFDRIDVNNTSLAGQYIQTHPSWRQVNATGEEANFYFDGTPLAGQSGGDWGLWTQSGVTQISGNLYKIASANKTTPTSYKTLPQVFFAGRKLLGDISGYNSSITSADSDNWKFCYVYQAGECYAGSSAGDVYFNAPGLYLDGYCGWSYDYTKPCFFSMPAASLGIAKYYASSGSSSPVHLTQKLEKYNWADTYSNATPIPDGSWLMSGITWGNGQRTDIWMIKNPPAYTADGIDRKTFIPAALSLTAPTGMGITQARVKFGYVENGSPTDYFCYGRRESCVATATSTATYKTYFFENSDSYANASCATSCTIYLPLIPLRIAYYKVEYLNSLNSVVSSQLGIAYENNQMNLSEPSVTPTPTPTPTPTASPTPTPENNSTPTPTQVSSGGSGVPNTLTPTPTPTSNPQIISTTPTPTPAPEENNPPVNSNNPNLSLIVLPFNSREGEVLKFSGYPTVYLVKIEGLYPFDSLNSLLAYQSTVKNDIKIINDNPGKFTKMEIFARLVETKADPVNYNPKPSIYLPTGSLAIQNKTVYYIYENSKIPFPSFSIFSGLGYSLKNVIKADLTGYKLPEVYGFISPRTEHPWGSWVRIGKSVYYFHPEGYIPAPSLEVLNSNRQTTNLPIVKANQTDISAIKKGPVLPIMVKNDPRIIK